MGEEYHPPMKKVSPASPTYLYNLALSPFDVVRSRLLALLDLVREVRPLLPRVSSPGLSRAVRLVQGACALPLARHEWCSKEFT